jgi:hypothetical protein
MDKVKALLGAVIITLLTVLLYVINLPNNSIYELIDTNEFFWIVKDKGKIMSSKNIKDYFEIKGSIESFIVDFLNIELFTNKSGYKIIEDKIIHYSFKNNILVVIGWKTHLDEIFSNLKIYLDYKRKDFSFNNLPSNLVNYKDFVQIPNFVDKRLIEYKDLFYENSKISGEQCELNFYIPVFTSLDIKKILSINTKVNLFKILPIAFLIVDRKGKIIVFSDKLKSEFIIKNKINDISDFFDELRGNLLPDSLSFQNSKKKILSLISTLDTTTQSIYTSLDGRFFQETISPLDADHVVFLFNDLTQFLSTKSELEEKNDNLVNIISNINEVVLILEDNFIIESNHPLLPVGDKIILTSFIKDNKFYLEDNIYTIKTISLSNIKTCLILNKDKSNHQLLVTEIDMIEKKINLIDNIIQISQVDDGDKKLQLLNYYYFKIERSLNRIKNIILEDNKYSNIEFIEFFSHIIHNVKSILPIKNFEIIHNEMEYKINVVQNIFSEAIYKIMEILYNNQFNQKKICTNNNNSKLVIQITGIKIEKSDEVFLRDTIYRSNYNSELIISDDITISIPIESKKLN